MFDLWKAIFEAFVNDYQLINLLGSEDNVMRGFQRVNSKKTQVVFNEVTPSGPLTRSTSRISNITFQITVFASTQRLVADVSSRIKRILQPDDQPNGVNLSSASIHCYLCEWVSWLTDLYWDKEVSTYRRDMDFRIVVREIS